MPIDRFPRTSREADDVAPSIAAFICRVGPEQAIDAVRSGWRWTGHIWVPAHAPTQSLSGLGITDTPTGQRGR